MGPGGQAGAARQQPPATPFASPAQPTLATRPVYPYPYVAKYKGTGDPKDAANYAPAKVPESLPIAFDTQALKLIGPDNQKFYHADNGIVVADTKQ